VVSAEVLSFAWPTISVCCTAKGKALAALNPPPGIPVIVISSGNQPPDQIAEHRELAIAFRQARM
jgi:hypothetical protein